MEPSGQRASARIARGIFLCLAGAALAVYATRVKPIRTGDGFEYIYTLQAWFEHGTPDVRPGDFAAADPMLLRNKIVLHRPGGSFIEGRDGRTYSLHFWFYPLLAVPAKAMLRVCGGDELAAFQVTNVLLFLVALYLTLFHARWPLWRRATLASLAAAGPVLWYLRWTHPEAATWSFTAGSLIFLTNEWYAAAALCAALGAQQNPPLLLLAAAAVALSLRTRRLRTVLLSAVAALVSFLPNVFSMMAFGQVNPILGRAGGDWHLISIRRTYGFLADLNQGLLPYVPVLVALFFVGAVGILRVRQLRGTVVLLALVAMILVIQITPNWNSDSAGLMRYAVWLLPVFAWVAAEGSRGGRWQRFAVGAGLVAHLAIVAVSDVGQGAEAAVEQRPLATWALTHVPWAYSPEPEIFAERQLGVEGELSAQLPIVFVAPDGGARKILTDRASLARLSEAFTVDASYARRLSERYGGRSGLFYVTPPRGAVRDPFAHLPVPTPREVRQSIRLRIVAAPTQVSAPQAAMRVRLMNQGDASYSSLRVGQRHALVISYRMLSPDGAEIDSGLFPALHGPLTPGTVTETDVVVPTPPDPGNYVLELAPHLYGPIKPGTIRCRVIVTAQGGQYHATITGMGRGQDQPADGS